MTNLQLINNLRSNLMKINSFISTMQHYKSKFKEKEIKHRSLNWKFNKREFNFKGLQSNLEKSKMISKVKLPNSKTM